MSSKPSASGVSELIAMLGKLCALEVEIESGRKVATRLKMAEEEYGLLHRNITDALRNMDVHSSGNAGWEGRTVWFLKEMIAQAAAREPAQHTVGATTYDAPQTR